MTGTLHQGVGVAFANGVEAVAGRNALRPTR